MDKANLNLHLGDTVLPDDDVGGNTVLTVVEEDNPDNINQYKKSNAITAETSCVFMTYIPSGFMDSPV